LEHTLEAGLSLRPRLAHHAAEEAKMKISGRQVRAGRELLGWTLLDLAYRARVSEPTISAFEEARRAIRPENVRSMRRALEAASIVFDADGRIRLTSGEELRSKNR
jgi:transcriptional regulator with XRE-family HTH domain